MKKGILKFSQFNESIKNIDRNLVISDMFKRVDLDEFNEWVSHNGYEEINNDIKEHFLQDEYSITVDENGIIEFYDLPSSVEDIIGDNFVKLYHFTASKLKKSILEKGLIKGYVKTNPYMNSYLGVYLTTQTSGAVINGYKYKIMQKHKSDVIQITVKMKLSEINPDDDDSDIESGKYQFYTDYIPPDRIIEIEKTY